MNSLGVALNGLLKGVVNGATNPVIEIEEKDSGAGGLKKVFVTEMDGNTVAFTPDESRNRKCTQLRCNRVMRGITSPLFNEAGGTPANQMCDAVVVRVRADRDLDVALIDLKGHAPTGFADQFRASECFVRYSLDLLRAFGITDTPYQVRRWRYVLLQPERFGIARKQPISRFEGQRSAADDPYRHFLPEGSDLPVSSLFNS